MDILVYSFEEAAVSLRLSMHELETLIAENQLPYVMICGQKRIRKTDLEEFVKNRPFW